MDEISLYFDASGNAGPVASLDEWAAFGEWADTLPLAAHDHIVHLWEQGWEDDLPALQDQLSKALDGSPPEDEDALAAAQELWQQLEDRAEADEAVAVGE